MLLLLITSLFFALTASAQETPSDSDPYVTTFEQSEGTDLVMVYIMSQDCGPCHDPEMKTAIDTAKRLLQSRAATEGKQFSAVGVVKNYDWEEGIAFLAESGYFDEVIAGRSWFNTGVVEHCWQDSECAPGMPMIRVFERDVTNAETPDGGSRYAFGPRRYLVTVKGGGDAEDYPDGIRGWVSAGAPLDAEWAFD